MSDDRTDIVLEQVLPALKAHSAKRSKESPYPFILGVTGLQGSGKSHLASAIANELNTNHNYTAIEVSLDDFYLTHEARAHIRKTNPSNKLLNSRGQPGTHDVQLVRSFFQQFLSQDLNEIWIPVFDKSQFSGDGDRLPRAQWKTIPAAIGIDILIFEGWCVGFQSLPRAEIESKQLEAVKTKSEAKALQRNSANTQFSITTLADHDIGDLVLVNEHLDHYYQNFLGPQHHDFLVHLDTDNLTNVYTWRIEQEHELIKKKGSGMTDEGVVRFVQGYMPAYELYLDGLRAGFFRRLGSVAGRKKQLTLLMDIHRNVIRHSLH